MGTGADQAAAGAAIQHIVGHVSGQVHLELHQLILVLVELVLVPDPELVVVVAVGVGVMWVESVAEDLGAVLIVIGRFGLGLLGLLAALGLLRR
jgi:hypothetical protein